MADGQKNFSHAGMLRKVIRGVIREIVVLTGPLVYAFFPKPLYTVRYYLQYARNVGLGGLPERKRIVHVHIVMYNAVPELLPRPAFAVEAAVLYRFSHV